MYRDHADVRKLGKTVMSAFDTWTCEPIQEILNGHTKTLLFCTEPENVVTASINQNSIARGESQSMMLWWKLRCIVTIHLVIFSVLTYTRGLVSMQSTCIFYKLRCIWIESDQS